MTKRVAQTYRGITFVRPKDYQGEAWFQSSFNPTLQQIKNLIDMAYAIQNSPPPKFDMSDFGSVDQDTLDYFQAKNISIMGMGWSGSVTDPIALKNIKKTGHICGTSCCAIGTSAWWGIGRLTPDMTWGEYSQETFGLEQNSNLWEFLFAGGWLYCDNTPEGAVARILRLVIEGPEVVDKDRVTDTIRDYDIRDDYIKSYAKYLNIKVLSE